MSLTIENPVAEARLRAFAIARGTTVDDAIIALLDDTINDDALTAADLEALQTGFDQLDRGEATDGVAFLDSLRQREGLPPYKTGFARRDVA